MPHNILPMYKLDQPNFQVASEEIQAQIYNKMKDDYGMPLKPYTHSMFVQRQKAVDALAAQKQPGQLGKRAHGGDETEKGEETETGARKRMFEGASTSNWGMSRPRPQPGLTFDTQGIQSQMAENLR